MCKWNYSVEIQLFNDVWGGGIIWACYPNDFHALLCYINEENDFYINKPSIRIRRADDKLKPDFQWPEDRKV